jgi:hypothetical protein
MTWSSERRRALVAVVLLALRCGGEAPTTPAAEHLSVRVKLTNASCDASRVSDFRSFTVRLVAPRSERSACVSGRPQSFEAIHDALAGRVAFRDLPEGPVTLKLEGYRDDACRDDKLGLCGLVEAQLAPTTMEVTIPIACDDGAGGAFTTCVSR